MNHHSGIYQALDELEAVLTRNGRAEWLQVLQGNRQALMSGGAPPEVYSQLAQLALNVEAGTLAADLLMHGLQVHSNSVQLHFRLADLLRQSGRNDDAILHYRKALEYQPDLVDAYLNVAEILRDRQRISEVIAWIEQALQACSHVKGIGAAALRVTLGEAVKISGETDRAISLFREALSLAPGHAYIYQTLAHTRKFSEVDDEVRAMEQHFHDPKRSCEDRSRLGFALGKAFEDMANFERSFHFYQKANMLHRASIDYDPGAMRAHFDELKKHFSPALFEAFRGQGSSSRAPIFIVGMPRSGTTLVEKILAAHPAVYGAGELTLVPECVQNLWSSSTLEGKVFPAGVTKLEPSALEDAADHYLQGISKIAVGEWRHVADKLPHNFINVGMIRLLFPEAKIIHCRRHPMDTCLSLYKHLFSGSHPYCYDQHELGRYYRLYLDLMEHWHAVLPGMIHDVDYAALVKAPRAEVEALLAFCGLPWDDSCLAHDRSGNRSVTASSVQVNRPIYTDSLDYWRNYANHLLPLKDALGEVAGSD